MRNLVKIFVMLVCLIATHSMIAQTPKLKFNKDGNFKIVQFTDIHFQYRNPASDVALIRIKEVLDAEKPDMVIFTGDIVYSQPADTAMRVVMNLVSERKIPFAVTFGNHDDEHGKSRSELYDLIHTIPYNQLPDRGEIASPDYVLPIFSSDGKKESALLYCMDSHSYSKLKDIKGYDWFKFNQISWYKEQSEMYKDKNGGNSLPALAFFHIPLPEYVEATSNNQAAMIGTRMEYPGSPEVNTGMFMAMKESGDVMATFVGHDHDNDYAVMWRGIMLAYGRFTGGNTEYNHLPNGARVIELKEGSRTFKSWIRLKKGEVINKITYPDSFIRGEWKGRPIERE